MCGRITLTLPDRVTLASALELDVEAAPGDYRPRYNVAPGGMHWIWIPGAPTPLRPAKWGLVPHWAKDPAIARKTIHARAETVGTRPAFRDAFRRRRCLVPADGFYEWYGPKGRKTPYWIHARDGGILPLAGLYETWRPDPDAPPLCTFTILTCAAFGEMARLHHRMPVILSPEEAKVYACLDAPPEAIAELLAPRVPAALEARPVSRRVNDVENDDPALLDPAGPALSIPEGSPGRDSTAPRLGVSDPETPGSP